MGERIECEKDSRGAIYFVVAAFRRSQRAIAVSEPFSLVRAIR